MPLARVLETEVMEQIDEAWAYDRMDHHEVNLAFVADFLAFARELGADTAAVHAAAVGTGDEDQEPTAPRVLDLGTGTAQVLVELCRQAPDLTVVGVDRSFAMLDIARANIDRANLMPRVRLEWADAKALPFADASFDAVISNSLLHHLAEPITAIQEALRVCRPGGWLFFRDLLRPDQSAQVEQLVNAYAAGADARQRQLFADSLRAALSLDEIRACLAALDMATETVRATSDRHWTWAAVREES